tara:strand:+ start:276 stop:929 length:654 start_codon:yes stop_codon:yes gene_type:complete
MTQEPDFISDEEIMTIPIEDNGEQLVNLRDYNKDIIIDIEEESKSAQKLPEDTCFVRENVAVMISKAQSLLPPNTKLKIIDGFRPMEAQKKIYAQVFEEIKTRNQNFSDKEVEKETDKIVANPKIVPFHTTGGAVDLTLADASGNELDLGIPVNSISDKSFTDASDLSKEARKNRDLLIKTMKDAGFVNYPLEFWHWSHGDRYWAAEHKTTSIYRGL